MRCDRDLIKVFFYSLINFFPQWIINCKAPSKHPIDWMKMTWHLRGGAAVVRAGHQVVPGRGPRPLAGPPPPPLDPRPPPARQVTPATQIFLDLWQNILPAWCGRTWRGWRATRAWRWWGWAGWRGSWRGCTAARSPPTPRSWSAGPGSASSVGNTAVNSVSVLFVKYGGAFSGHWNSVKIHWQL